MPDPQNDLAPGMVRCEVTQDLIPEDETVVIQGKRVCARGKQILLDQLQGGYAPDSEPEAPGSLARFGASLLDGIIVGAVGFALGIAFAGVILAANPGTDNAIRIQAGLQIVATLIGMLYFTLMHANSGQTLGKKAAKMKVINLDGSKISTPTALVRALAFTGIQGIGPVVLLIGGMSLAVASGIFSMVVGVYALTNAITVLVSRDKRALHDMIAGTRVISTQA